MFGYRLCLELGFPHPDYLWPWLTWEQVIGWRKAWNQDPWGEVRADMRAAANTFWQAASGNSSDLPDLSYPYFKDDSVLWAKHEELEQKRKAMGPELEAKLKEARRRHREAKEAAKR